MERETGSSRVIVIPQDPVFGEYQGRECAVLSQRTTDGVTHFLVHPDGAPSPFWVSGPESRETASEQTVERERGS